MANIGFELPEVNISWLRGDTLNLKILQLSEKEGETKIPIHIGDRSWKMHLRSGEHSGTLVKSFGPLNFYFGQSQEAIDYDTQEGNPPGTTQDELHVQETAENMRFDSGTYLFDLEAKKGDNIQTFYGGSFHLRPDVTREAVHE